MSDETSAGRVWRAELFARWSAARQTPLLVIGAREDAPISMAECVRFVYEHVRELPERPLDGIDLMLVGAGLPCQVGARLASLLREYARRLDVFVTGAVGPGETLASLAADTLWMHPMATLTTVLPASEGREGLQSLVGDLVDARGDVDPQRHAWLDGADPDAVGDALHRVRWAQAQVAQLVASRLQPPDDAAADELARALTRGVQRSGEPLARREARALAALPVRTPDPDLEGLAFELHVAYEHELALLSPRTDGPRAIIESATMLHTLAVDAAGETPRPVWSRHFEEAVH